MNLNFINKEFERLSILENCIDYQFEPKANNIGGKRNIYYDDLKLDFVDEVNTFGFSPFILQGFEKQRKNPNIMRYMTKKFNHGLTNYVRKKNHPGKYRKEKEVIEKKQKEIKLSENSSIHLKLKEQPKVAKKEIFLQKALENLALDKLNISTDEDHLFEENLDDDISGDINGKKNEKSEEIYTKIVEANKKRIMEQLREKYFKSVQHQPDNILPKVTMTDFEKPTALKVNFENLFIKKNKGSQEEFGEYKKIVALSKNKEYLFSGGMNMKNNMLKTEGNWNKNEDGTQRIALKTISTTINNTGNKKRVKFKTLRPQCTTTTSNKSRTVNLRDSTNHNEEFLLILKAKKYKDCHSPNKVLATATMFTTTD